MNSLAEGKFEKGIQRSEVVMIALAEELGHRGLGHFVCLLHGGVC